MDLKCPENAEGKPERIETDDYIYIPISKKLLPYILCQRQKPSNEDFFTYFISDGTFTKIGKAVNPSERLKILQTGNPTLLRIELIVFANVESVFHEQFSVHKLLNEWFDLPIDYKSIVSVFCEHKNLKLIIRENNDGEDS